MKTTTERGWKLWLAKWATLGLRLRNYMRVYGDAGVLPSELWPVNDNRGGGIDHDDG